MQSQYPQHSDNNNDSKKFDYQGHPLRNFAERVRTIVANHKVNLSNTDEKRIIVDVDVDKGTKMTLAEYWENILKPELPMDERSDPGRMMKVALASSRLDTLVEKFTPGWFSRLFPSESCATYSALLKLQESKVIAEAKLLESKAETEAQKLKLANAAALATHPAEQTTQTPIQVAIVESSQQGNGYDNDTASHVSGRTLQGTRVRTKLDAAAVVDDTSRDQITKLLFERVKFEEQRFDILGAILSGSLKAKEPAIFGAYTDLAVAILVSPNVPLSTIINNSKAAVAHIKGPNRAKLSSLMVQVSPAHENEQLAKWKDHLKQKLSVEQRNLPEEVALATVCANWYFSQEFSNVMRPKFPKVAEAIDNERNNLLKRLTQANNAVTSRPDASSNQFGFFATDSTKAPAADTATATTTAAATAVTTTTTAPIPAGTASSSSGSIGAPSTFSF